ncbi:MAG: DUF721 domain-containing protein [Bacteriovoracaceae bacterium]|nr:DUF721 domain-containing protein [Bacteriovoracaceae bacterium]
MFKKVSDLLGQTSYSFKKTQYWNKGNSTRPSELFDFLSLIARWEEIVGPKLAKVTVPLKNQKKILTILTNHSGYSQSLSMMEETLKAKILKVFPELQGKINRLNFIVSTQHFEQERLDLLKRASVHKTEEVKSKKQNQLHPQSPKYKALKEEASLEFADFEEDIKEKLISLYIQNKEKNSH